MLVPHDPVLDPRIEWEASYAAKKFDVTLIGLQERPTCSNKTESETTRPYRIKVLPPGYQKGNLLFFFYNLFLLLPKLTRYAATLLFILTFPILTVGEFVFQFFTVLCKIIFRGISFLIRKIASFFQRLYSVSFIIRMIGILFSKLKMNITTTIQSPIKKELDNCLWYLSYTAMITMTFLHEISTNDKKPDVIHCNDIYSLLAGLIAKRKFGCNVIYDMHEYAPYVDPHASWLRVQLFKWYEGFLVKRVDHTVTVNPLLAKLIAKNYKLKKITSVPNAAPWENISGPIHGGGEMTKLAAGRLKFLYQGNFAPGRGIDELIQNWVHIDKTKAALFLRGPYYGREEYLELARKSGLLNTSVYFLEPVVENKLIDAAREADIGLIPYQPIIINHIYCCPNKLSQYMQAGLMIISNNLLYVKQVIEESQSGLSYDSTMSLINALRLAIDDIQLRKSCQENSLAYAKNTFNWQKTYSALEDLYVAYS
jgi:glycosyltransferase involved in cell wall biosynthesis